ncbi:putative ribosome biogenesis protein slx9-like isoform X1 [Coffea eugenioides]|uniref:putative ribosome biogenesis protein slx9-like isoform X1 n=1 Tax=Coffea eugenioides TaxID=49369 RepID=UPI000F60832B|nr:putative ribosome biogenesis protein slx9-like isoform X1 [Coffea eugenioides]
MGKPSSGTEAKTTRAERKFEKKVQFYSKVRDTVASLTAQKAITKKKTRSRQKKLKAYDFSSLTEFLPELKTPQQRSPLPSKLNSKTRQNLVLKEGNQLKTVLNHPAFQSDPLGSIHQHLQNTQPLADKKPKPKYNKSESKEAKRKRSKASRGPQQMEV